MKLLIFISFAFVMCFCSCAHRKTHRVIIHKVHTPKIKDKTKLLPEEKPVKEEKVRIPSEREKPEPKSWFSPCT